MLFYTYKFVFVFLPATFAIYFLLNRLKLVIAAKAFLVLASVIFYGYWNFQYVPLLFGSIIFNFAAGASFFAVGNSPRKRKFVLATGIIGNLLCLGYFKYMNFFLDNLSAVTGYEFSMMQIILPLGISFFTFTQIAFLVDTYRNECKEYNFLNYMLFVTFFPHLLAGPIIHHKEMMPQFDRLRNKLPQPANIAKGLFLFSLGMFKKVVMADFFASPANIGFSNAEGIVFTDAWLTSISYTFQLYFDFSGYTDMALGIALLFNIIMPDNFNSPYLALNIQDFWRRWHMTLSRFLRDYVYIPLGGNRAGPIMVYANLVATFLIGGFWHGAGWTFIVWGLLHGVAVAAHRAWVNIGMTMSKPLALALTFGFVNLTWVFFRADSMPTAISMLTGMMGFHGMLPQPDPGSDNLYWISILDRGGIGGFDLNIATFIIFSAIAFVPLNTMSMGKTFKPGILTLSAAAGAMILAVLNFVKSSPFLYFQF